MSDFTSDFWNLYVAGLTLVSIIACLILLWVAGTTKAATVHDNTTGHVWDGDLREINNPLPKWWVYLFIITCLFALAYGALYPMFGKFQGVLGWSSQGQHTTEVEKVEAAIAPIYAKFQGMKPEDMAGDAQAMAIGERLFMNYCAQCHGSDARGAKSFPNLTDGDWLGGGDPATIKNTIANGRMGVMPPMAAAVGSAEDVRNVANYVLSLSGSPSDAVRATQGKEKFAACAACHGMDGKGMAATGAPNLTDSDWLGGGDHATIKATVANGRIGVMPPMAAAVGGAEDVRNVANYVLSLSGSPSDAVRAAQGKEKFAACAACHGMDAKGMAATGAPNLTDGIWLHGWGEDAIIHAVNNGFTNQMPAQAALLNEAQINVLASYVWGLSNKPAK